MAQSLERVKGRAATAPHARGAIEPILAELCAAARPGAQPPGSDRREDPGGDAGRARRQAIKGVMGVHALVYLAKHRFGCPGLEPYHFASSALSGVYSPALGTAIDSLETIGAPGGMEWDADGRFARLVRDRGGDGVWLSVAALLCMMDDAARTMGDLPGRWDLVEGGRVECGAFSRSRMSEVYDDLCEMGILERGARGRVVRD